MTTPEPFGLRGRVAVVTGASSGLGRHAARVLHRAGATVVLTARRAERLEHLCDELGERSHWIAADLAVRGAAAELVAQIVPQHPVIDVLVNVAGIADEDTALREGGERFRQVLEVNLSSVFDLSVAVAKVMRESGHGGTIVNVASILGLRGSPAAPGAGYAASKGGLINLTRELAAQWSRYGIRVNALAPGFFHSEMTETMLEPGSAMRELLENRTLMGRIGRPDELDGPLLLLASSASSYMTGQIVAVDGGWTAV